MMGVNCPPPPRPIQQTYYSEAKFSNLFVKITTLEDVFFLNLMVHGHQYKFAWVKGLGVGVRG